MYSANGLGKIYELYGTRLQIQRQCLLLRTLVQQTEGLPTIKQDAESSIWDLAMRRSKHSGSSATQVCLEGRFLQPTSNAQLHQHLIPSDPVTSKVPFSFALGWKKQSLSICIYVCICLSLDLAGVCLCVCVFLYQY